MKAAPFALHRASSLEDALHALADAPDDTKLLAGGQSLLPLMALRMATPARVVSIDGLAELDHLADEAAGLRIGALRRHADLERPVGPEWGMVAEAARLIGHLPIRTRGTIGGSLAHADMAAEWCLVLSALDGEVELTSLGGTRTLTADELLLGPYTTAIAPDEILTQVRLARPPRGARTGFAEVSVRSGDFATAAVAAGVALDGLSGRICWARLALGGLAGTPLRAREVEELLVGRAATPELLAEAAARAAALGDPPEDPQTPPAVRRRMVETLTVRTLGRLAEAAGRLRR